MKEITVNADVKKLDEVLGFVNEIVEQHDCSPAAQFQLEVALEEIYVNIAHHAYPNEVGQTTIRCKVKTEESKPPLVIIDILDQGIPYNPIEHDDPDIDLELDDRDIGGLGIYMIKNSMDNLSYRYEENHNIFTVEKYLNDA